MAKNNITMLEQKLQKVTEAGIKAGIEKKLVHVRERYDITHNIDKVSAILDGLEGLFDQLEAQLIRTKQSKCLTPCILGNFYQFVVCFLFLFFQVRLFQNSFQECHQSDKQFGSRSVPTFCRAFIWNKAVCKDYQQMS